MKLVVCEVNLQKARTGKTVEVEIDSSKSVLELRQEICKVLKVRVNNLIVFLDDEFLDADVTLESYSIHSESSITYEIKLCGPVPINRDWTSSGYVKRRLGAEITNTNPSITMDV